MLHVAVTGITGQSPNHQLSVPHVWTVTNGTASRGTTCPPRLFTPAVTLVCLDETGPSEWSSVVGSHARFKHDSVESSVSSPRI